MVVQGVKVLCTIRELAEVSVNRAVVLKKYWQNFQNQWLELLSKDSNNVTLWCYLKHGFLLDMIVFLRKLYLWSWYFNITTWLLLQWRILLHEYSHWNSSLNLKEFWQLISSSFNAFSFISMQRSWKYRKNSLQIYMFGYFNNASFI